MADCDDDTLDAVFSEGHHEKHIQATMHFERGKDKCEALVLFDCV